MSLRTPLMSRGTTLMQLLGLQSNLMLPSLVPACQPSNLLLTSFSHGCLALATIQITRPHNIFSTLRSEIISTPCQCLFRRSESNHHMMFWNIRNALERSTQNCTPILSFDIFTLRQWMVETATMLQKFCTFQLIHGYCRT